MNTADRIEHLIHLGYDVTIKRPDTSSVVVLAEGGANFRTVGLDMHEAVARIYSNIMTGAYASTPNP